MVSDGENTLSKIIPTTDGDWIKYNNIMMAMFSLAALGVTIRFAFALDSQFALYLHLSQVVRPGIVPPWYTHATLWIWIVFALMAIIAFACLMLLLTRKKAALLWAGILFFAFPLTLIIALVANWDNIWLPHFLVLFSIFAIPAWLFGVLSFIKYIKGVPLMKRKLPLIIVILISILAIPFSLLYVPLEQFDE